MFVEPHLTSFERCCSVLYWIQRPGEISFDTHLFSISPLAPLVACDSDNSRVLPVVPLCVSADVDDPKVSRVATQFSPVLSPGAVVNITAPSARLPYHTPGKQQQSEGIALNTRFLFGLGIVSKVETKSGDSCSILLNQISILLSIK